MKYNTSSSAFMGWNNNNTKIEFGTGQFSVPVQLEVPYTL